MTKIQKILFVLFLLLFGCDDAGSQDDSQDTDTSSGTEHPEIPIGATIIAIGDSIMAWNLDQGGSIPEVVGEELDTPVYNAAVSGALFTDKVEPDIPGQYVPGDWEWLIMDGGGNDFNELCQCNSCDAVMDEIISPDGTTGALPDFVDDVIANGVRVILMGYYSVPDTAMWGFADCVDTVTQYAKRQQLLAQNTEDLWFLDGRTIIDATDLDVYIFDHVHPSIMGSRQMGEAIAQQILALE